MEIILYKSQYMYGRDGEHYYTTNIDEAKQWLAELFPNMRDFKINSNDDEFSLSLHKYKILADNLVNIFNSGFIEPEEFEVANEYLYYRSYSNPKPVVNLNVISNDFKL